MVPDWVIDVGNSRVKFAHCKAGAVVAPVVRVALAKATEPRGTHTADSAVAIAGSVPAVCEQVAAAYAANGNRTLVINDHAQLGLTVDVDQPERVGLDRLLNALAAQPLLGDAPAAVVVDAGSAITCDLVTPGRFGGGAILPGLRLMAAALHQHTAQLPLITPSFLGLDIPGRVTEAAMNTGVIAAAVGGVAWLIDLYREALPADPLVVVTGGDGDALAEGLRQTRGLAVTFAPHLTLDGIRLAAGRQP